MPIEPLHDLARAKLNLCLHVTGRREDGYHLLDSLVAFPALGDRLWAEPAAGLSLSVCGPFADQLPSDGDNLVLRAAALFGAGAALRLEKNLPAAGGIGGGSADAAATLRLMARMQGAPLPEARRVLALGADVPVCLESRPARMAGIGEQVTPLAGLPALWCVLVNPGTACPTPRVFAALERRDGSPLPELPARFADAAALLDYLFATRNDLEAPARRLVPAIGDALEALAASGAAVARMSGSGATCFGLFETEGAALSAAESLRAAAPAWWVAAAPLG